jgi:hypothetical protein
MPTAHTVAPATAAPGLVPEPKTAWEVLLPDRAVAMKAAEGQVTVLTHDGSLTVIGADGRVASQKAVEGAERQQVADALRAAPDAAALDLAKKHCPPDRVVKHVAAREGVVAVGYWGGTLAALAGDGPVKARRQMPQDLCGLAWLGDRLLAALADGRVVALTLQ